MPIHEYRCRPCGAVFELLVRSSGSEGNVCPACGSGEVKKLFSVFAMKSNSSMRGPMTPCKAGPSAMCEAAASDSEGCPNGSCPMRLH